MSDSTAHGAVPQDQKQSILDSFPDPRRNTRQYLDDERRHTDARSIREKFGIPPWDRDAYDYQTVVPNCWEHTWDAPLDEDAGGTDFLCTGKPGKGKSTLACYTAARMLETNDEKVVWRGSPARSEWLPLAPWTRLCLPEHGDISVRLESRDPRKPAVDLTVEELEEIVREVVWYSDPIQLNREILQEGQIHVVYPDPTMHGCQDVYEQSEEKTYEGLEFSPSDPANHWWFAWMLARVERGPHHWTTWICDEVGDLAPQSAQNDEFSTYQKVVMMKDCWVDARKFGFTIFAFGHSEKDIHQLIRQKIRWRIQMRGSANPTSASSVVGFGSVPMETDMTSHMSVGRGLMYTETNFSKFAWKDMPTPTDHKLKISLSDRA